MWGGLSSLQASAHVAISARRRLRPHVYMGGYQAHLRKTVPALGLE